MSWPTARISDLTSSATAGFACGESDPEGIAQIRMNNVGLDGAINFDKVRRVPRTAASIDRYLLQSDDVLFNATNSPELVGKTALARGLPEPFVYSNHFIRIRTDQSKLLPVFLAKWLTAQQQAGRFELMCNKWVNQASVRREDLLALRMPLPPLPEQRRIAAILDKADALRAKRREAIAKLDQLLQSVFLDMFGDAVTNLKGWQIVEVGTLVIDGPQNGLYKPASDYGTGTPILRIDGFRAGDVIDRLPPKRLRLDQAEIAKYRLRPADLVINRVNSPEHLGKPALIGALSEDVVFESNMMRLSLDQDRVSPRYLLKCLLQKSVRDQISKRRKDAVNQSSINQTDVGTLTIPLPPIAIQKKFAAIVDAVSKQQVRIEAATHAVGSMLGSIQQAAFSGAL